MTKDIEAIRKILPHRYPFLMIDRVLEVREGEFCKAVKNVTINEPIFQGHFPEMAVFPGVLQLEAMAQTSAFIIDSVMQEDHGLMAFYAGVNNAKFRKQVVPGDQLVIESTLANRKKNFWVFNAKALVEGKVVAQAEVRLMGSP
ncbi:MAG TPA: 3-hydroxyacyl-ACP dehydratase FabZ [Deltaproteobacteria bacterium]|nr:3-hydroxyacyl-[acyl-carrier-protein] dehydratase FabZ [Deltaproteobacteria bacterium]MDE0908710.1 3-hydroxyacyl-ACP dehydratase FabZ [SAR324 cluster bacterium]HIF68590.1 3-hydroxyacyl-ACP dehydratase FabZ [Candidatus Lambdaproteobacteria bacterium]HIL16020.1 3-hydroxyacyl-ACP dehydratase FabZ [Deltaproteobacteria bacterium]